MLTDSPAVNSFAVDDLEAARAFYAETLGLTVTVIDEEVGLMQIEVGGGRTTMVYAKPDFVPATYTIMNFPVPDVAAAVDGLVTRGVGFDRYEGFSHDERGIVHGPPGPDIAWFRDPAGNILAVMSEG
jgi:predicted enzyme related to lactoylglutathione lyase